MEKPPGKWAAFAEYAEKRPLDDGLAEAVALVKKKDTTLDMGAGALNETGYLLQSFKKVIALDAEPSIVERAKRLEGNEHLDVVVSRFEEYEFPPNSFDLITARYALPFMPEDSFNEVFKKMKASLRPEGIFVGQLFGNNDSRNGRKDVSTHSEEEVDELFADMEILHCEEREYEGPASDGIKHWHVFDLVARKEKVPEIKIVPVTPGDAEGITEVMYKAWLATYPNEEAGITIDDIEDSYKDRLLPERIQKSCERLANIPVNEQRLVAKIDGRIVGVLRVIREEDKNTLQTLYVLPECHGKGIGTDLWKAGKAFLDSGKDTYLKVAEYNEHAIAFYKRLGFEDTGKRFADERFRMKSGSIIPEMEMRLEAENVAG